MIRCSDLGIRLMSSHRWDFGYFLSLCTCMLLPHRIWTWEKGVITFEIFKIRKSLSKPPPLRLFFMCGVFSHVSEKKMGSVGRPLHFMLLSLWGYQKQHTSLWMSWLLRNSQDWIDSFAFLDWLNAFYLSKLSTRARKMDSFSSWTLERPLHHFDRFHICVSSNFAEFKITVLPAPDFSQKMSVFSFQMLFLQICTKGKVKVNIWDTGGHNDLTDFPQLNWYIFARWQLHLGCSASIIVSVRSRTLRAAARSIYRARYKGIK